MGWLHTHRLFGVLRALLARDLSLSSTVTPNLREVLVLPSIDPMCRRALSTYTLQSRTSAGTVIVQLLARLALAGVSHALVNVRGRRASNGVLGRGGGAHAALAGVVVGGLARDFADGVGLEGVACGCAAGGEDLSVEFGGRVGFAGDVARLVLWCL